MGFMVAVDEKIGLVAVDPNGMIAFFRPYPVEFIGDPAAQLRNADIKAFPFRQEFATDFRGEFPIQKTHGRRHGNFLSIPPP
jgi:hypothetical protein